MKKFTEEQIEMLGILPNNIAQSADFTLKAKLLLAELIFRNGMDKVADDGYFFATNSELMEASGYSNRHVAVAINRFVNLGFISRKVGKYKGNASEYILDMKKIENYESTKGVVKGCTFEDTKGDISELKGDILKGDILKGDIFHIEDAKNDIMQLINELRSEIKELKGDISELKGDILKGDIFKKVTTDTDTDSDTDKESIYVYSENETEVTDTFTEVEVTDEDKSISVQGEGEVEVATSSVAGTEIDEDTSIEVKETSPRVKLSKEEITRRNDYISKVFERLNTKLDYLYTLKTFSLYNDVCAEITNVITDAQGHRDWFTSKQWEKLIWYCERFCKITEVKDNYFNGTKIKDADADVTSTDDDKNFTEKCIDSSIDGGGLRREIKPTDWEKVGEWVADSLEKFPTYDAWQKELDRILNKKFGEGWESAEYRIMAQASAIHNRCTKTAIQHYTSIKNAQKTTPTPTENQTDLAPWEMEKEDTVAEIDPTLDGYLTPSVEDVTEAPQDASDSVSDAEPTNYPSDEIEANTEVLNEPVANFGDTVEPDDEDMAFDDYVVMSQASRTTTEYGYRYAV